MSRHILYTAAVLALVTLAACYPSPTPTAQATRTASETPAPTSTLAPPPTNSTRPTATRVPPTPIVMGCPNASSVNVRNGPGTEYNAVSFIKQADCVHLTARNGKGTWVVIDSAPNSAANGGWVSAAYLTVTGNVDSLPIATAPPAPNPVTSITTQPTPTKTSAPPPTRQPTQPPQPTAAPSGFTVTYLTSPVSVGAYATLTIQTAPGASCFLSYTTPHGTLSRAQGLGATTADGSGICSWTWKIGTNTYPGTGTLTVSANGVTQYLPIIIQ